MNAQGAEAAQLGLRRQRAGAAVADGRARTAPTWRASPPATAASAARRRSPRVLISLPPEDARSGAQVVLRLDAASPTPSSTCSTLADELESCRSRSTSAWAPTATPTTAAPPCSRWIDAALARARAQRLRRRRATPGRSAPRSPGDIGYVMGRIHTSGHGPAREPGRRHRVGGRRQRRRWTCRRTSWRSGTARRTASPCRCGRRAADVDRPGRAAASTSRTASSQDGTLPEHLQRALPPGQRLQLHLDLSQPVLLRGPASSASRRARGRCGCTGREVRDGRYHGWIERDDPRRLGRDRRAGRVALPVVLLRALERRRLVGQLAGVRPARGLRRQPRRGRRARST